jgi:hypothetical protein
VAGSVVGADELVQWARAEGHERCYLGPDGRQEVHGLVIDGGDLSGCHLDALTVEFCGQLVRDVCGQGPGGIWQRFSQWFGSRSGQRKSAVVSGA